MNFMVKLKMKNLPFRKKLLDKAKNFLTSYDNKVSKRYKVRMEKAKKIMSQNPKKYQSVYNITDKMIENSDKKVEKEKKRKAEERERERDRENERNEKIRKLREDKIILVKNVVKNVIIVAIEMEAVMNVNYMLIKDVFKTMIKNVLFVENFSMVKNMIISNFVICLNVIMKKYN